MINLRCLTLSFVVGFLYSGIILSGQEWAGRRRVRPGSSWGASSPTSSTPTGSSSGASPGWEDHAITWLTDVQHRYGNYVSIIFGPGLGKLKITIFLNFYFLSHINLVSSGVWQSEQLWRCPSGLWYPGHLPCKTCSYWYQSMPENTCILYCYSALWFKVY